MGLDITAYEKVQLLKAQPEGWDDELGGRDDVRVLHTPDGVPDRSDGLVRGYYTVDPDGEQEHVSFSYSGYSEWRRWLCLTFVGVPPETVWTNPEAYAESPFVELVNYADNEGFFGPKTCAKLAADFAAHEPRNSAYHAERYERLRRAFHLAAGGGVVRFH